MHLRLQPHGQNLVETSIALALVAIVVIGALGLAAGKLNGLYTSIACQIAVSQTPNPCGTTGTTSEGLPFANTLHPSGPTATFINPSLQVQYSGPFHNFIGGNQCTPDCPFGSKFIGIPNFVNDPDYDTYANGIISIIDKNQCTYGAVAEWLTIHQDDPLWNPSNLNSYPPIHDNAGAMYQRAVDAGYTVSPTPLSGSMVIYKIGWAGSTFGHIATVVGVSADGKHYTVVEQNVLYLEVDDESGIDPSTGAAFAPNAYRWNLGGFDIRTAQFPDPEIAGFIYGPPGTTLPTDPAIITGYVGPSPSP
jgi:Flp pilus assembly pilin Flp